MEMILPTPEEMVFYVERRREYDQVHQECD